jgi:alpha-amylase/alpha-mannosidase (GH57 family)
MAEVYHAVGLNMHQPLGNLLALHNSDERWEAKQILWCYDRPTRMLEGYEDVARLHISFSGTILKQLEDPAIRETFHDVVDVEDFMNRYRRSNIEFVGTGLYHPVYPLTPSSDWDTQTSWWIGLGQHLIGPGLVRRILAAGNGLLHGDDPDAEEARIQICARRLLVHQA